jgi:hypothetical protein
MHAANIAVRILRTRIEKKIENILGEDQFGSGRGKALGIQHIQFRAEGWGQQLLHYHSK